MSIGSEYRILQNSHLERLNSVGVYNGLGNCNTPISTLALSQGSHLPKDLSMQEASPFLYLKEFSGALGAGWTRGGANT